MIYLQLMTEFFKTGLFAIGGGLATLPFLREISLSHPDWYSLKELSNMIAVANATPGPIGINMATYAGYSTGGILGGILSTFGIILPSFFIIIVISKILEKFKGNKYVEGAFAGLRPAVVALIMIALLQLAKEVFVNKEGLFGFLDLKHTIFFLAFFAFTRIYKKDKTILYIVAGALIGILFKM